MKNLNNDVYYQMKQVIHQPDKVKDYIEQLEELE